MRYGSSPKTWIETMCSAKMNLEHRIIHQKGKIASLEPEFYWIYRSTALDPKSEVWGGGPAGTTPSAG